jgi:lysophospholipase-2
LAEGIAGLRVEKGLEPVVDDDVQVFLARGTRDMMVPRRYHRLCSEKLRELGVKEECLTVKEYKGQGHSIGAGVLRDLCTWLEKVVPAVVE